MTVIRSNHNDEVQTFIVLSESGKTYLVSQANPDFWTCTCPAWRYRRRSGSSHCKHTAFVSEVAMREKEKSN